MCDIDTWEGEGGLVLTTGLEDDTLDSPCSTSPMAEAVALKPTNVSVQIRRRAPQDGHRTLTGPVPMKD